MSTQNNWCAVLFPESTWTPDSFAFTNLADEQTRHGHGLSMFNIDDQILFLERVKQAKQHMTYGGYFENRTLLWDGFEPFRPMIHLGVDFNNLPVGEPVASVCDGKVAFAKSDNEHFNGWGGRVIIESGDLFYLYGHMKDLRVNASEDISKGTIIGVIGDPKHNGGWFPHLHFQVMRRKYVEQFADISEIDGYSQQFENMEQMILDPMQILAAPACN